MKKLTCFVSSLIVCAAQASADIPYSFTGPYLKGAVGVTSVRFDVTPDENATPPFNFQTFGDTSLVATSPMGLLGAGYLYQFSNPFVLGAEVTAGFADASTDQTVHLGELILGGGLHIDIGNTIDVKMTNDFSLLLKPGVVANTNTLFYFLLGPRWGNFEISTTADVDLVLGGPPQVASAAGETSGYELGFTAGLGLEHRITENLRLGLEYMYTTYGNIDTPSIASELVQLGVPLASVTDAPEVQASTNTVMFALFYAW